ncbi:hypothetical protein ACH5RR_023860 [Cinchona calisaya]|uniref:Uncharacterized protein n=1 Tax=Cinchona calisaya TaxID=153742 RepID=A0ABD2ZBX6_9GENT
MSSTSSSLVLLFLLCLASYAFNVRAIRAINNENEPAKSSHFSVKNEEKSNLAVENDKVKYGTQSTFAKSPERSDVYSGVDINVDYAPATTAPPQHNYY